MDINKIEINNIPSVIWGEKSNKVFIAIHGNMSNKEDYVIRLLADNVTSKGYQVLSFDLPEHGERKENKEYLYKVQNCIKDLRKIIDYTRANYNEINIFACSIGVYFSLLEYKKETINQCLFLSPVVNMKYIIDNMMTWSNITERELEEKQKINTNFGQTLYWDYYLYVKNNPIIEWNKKTYILYGDKDNMQDKDIMKDFVKRFNCNVSILENGEHYFHTKEQLEYYQEWLDNSVK